VLKPTEFRTIWIWNVMAHAQKQDFVFQRNGRDHLNRQVHEFSRLLAAELCGSAVVMLDTPCSEVVWRVLATHYIRQFPLHFPSGVSPCAITFQLDSTMPTSNTAWSQKNVTKNGPVLWPAAMTNIHAVFQPHFKILLLILATTWDNSNDSAGSSS